MSSARDRARSLRDRAAAAAEAESARAEAAPAVRPAEDAGRKVRQTVDLTLDRHKQLGAWRLDTALALGRTRLTTQDVLSAAVDVLLTDESVARRVRHRLEEIEEEAATRRR